MTTPPHGNDSANCAVPTPVTPSRPGGVSLGGPARVPVPRVDKMLEYPPAPAKGRITVTTEDYACLKDEALINDVIIEFYLKFFMETEMSLIDKNRTHVFSTFFYTRLTTKDPRDPNDEGSPAERRHARVRRWTKAVDLFSKDFIVVPVNTGSHWLLAVICFPGLTHAVRMSDGKPPHYPSETRGHAPHVGSTTSTPFNVESVTAILDPDTEAREEADSDDEDDMEPDSSDEEPCEELGVGDAKHPLPETKVEQEPIKQPCILIFDSLNNAYPSRIRGKICAALRSYLQVEYNVKHKASKGDRNINVDNFRATVVRIPEQTNLTDCGLFLLQNFEAFYKTPITDYRLPVKGLEGWFDVSVVLEKRFLIQELLHHIMTQQGVDLNLPDLGLLPGGAATESEGVEELLHRMMREQGINQLSLDLPVINLLPEGTADVSEAGH